MKTAYVKLTGTTVKVVNLDNNVGPFFVSVRLAAGVTVLGALENPNDSNAPNAYFPAVTTQGPVWFALPAPVNGIVTLMAPYAALQFTPTAGGVCTVLQQDTDFLGTVQQGQGQGGGGGTTTFFVEDGASNLLADGAGNLLTWN